MEFEVIRPVISAPSSPTRFSPFIDLISLTNTNQEQEEEEDQDFEFSIHELEPKSPITADELFSGGKIRTIDEPSSNSMTKQTSRRISDHHQSRETERISSKSIRRSARSLSPLRNSNYNWEEETQKISASKKWKFKDLFRSASEGRAGDKDPLRKYAAIFRRSDEVKGSSFRLAEGSISRRRTMGGPVSAHEIHYTVNRAVSQELKKKSFLPYKQGILGRLAFIPTVHGLAGGFGFSHK
ncbi:uncharacterized protein LOC124938981 [Impatiens glandulifera]|uniref:uncharacterized protein LOC124938981 n=1 Tax=Impatiens glandulifera TaxID=253017 RepID=UPI001FB067B5|nr:uncharacterized protein LOC124938981 [Impatiens glandulifera]